jgi:hypothetical protein
MKRTAIFNHRGRKDGNLACPAMWAIKEGYCETFFEENIRKLVFPPSKGKIV